jgi:hypothetical protein
MPETRSNMKMTSIQQLTLIALVFSLLAVASYCSRAEAQPTFEPVHPEFIYTMCGDRLVSIAWSTTVEESLAARAQIFRDAGLPIPDSLKFGGYRVWRSERPDTSVMMLLREFTRADSISWTLTGNVRAFVDPDSLFEIRLVRVRVGYDSVYVRMRVALDIPGPFNGMGYFYSITYFDSMKTQRSAKEDCFLYLPVHPVADQNPDIQRVWVVPNPYHGSAAWDYSEGRRIQFVNLPATCTVSIYTVAGDLVTKLQHPDPDYYNYGSYGGALNWNLKNDNNEYVVPGVYVFLAEGEGGEAYRGHFVIIY